MLGRYLRALGKRCFCWLETLCVTFILTPFNLIVNLNKASRKLEIGPGDCRIQGFETLNILAGNNVDYVLDASKKMPFKKETFDIIYASHILEHIPWYQVEETIAEWVRLLKRGGVLEVWVPDGLKICNAFIEYEVKGNNEIEKDGWFKFNPEKSPYKWIAGRLFAYGDGTGNSAHPNWHRAIFSRKYLKAILEKNGLIDVRELNKSNVRAYDHGWINLGYRGQKA